MILTWSWSEQDWGIAALQTPGYIHKAMRLAIVLVVEQGNKAMNKKRTMRTMNT